MKLQEPSSNERPWRGAEGGGPMSPGFAVTVAIWPREVVSCCDFILLAVATFWAMSLVRIYPGRTSNEEMGLHKKRKHLSP